MGLTLHYTFAAPNRTPAQARALVDSLRQHALTLPFTGVTGIIDLQGPHCRFNPDDQDPHAWLKVQTTRFETEEEGDTARVTAETHPLHILAFTIDPAEGSESANVGLCLYPGSSSDWSWSSFCKTQYASNPANGDVANFLTCHLALINLLDHAKHIGILELVHDESNYWETRDLPALTKEVARWNRMVAGFYGSLRDSLESAGHPPDSLQSEITKFPTFEKLEADSQHDQA